MEMSGTRVSPVDELASRLRVKWPTIIASRAAAEARIQKLNEALGQFTTDDTSIVLVGSLGRRELTSGSDLDWVLLVDGSASPEHLDASLQIEAQLRKEEVKGPGADATFGGLVFSHDLINYIGGEDDSNRNTTLRMLLVLESVCVGRSDAYSRVLNNILYRYIVEDYGWMHGRNPMNVPRFLQNDIARYWRILAVDFAYKRRQRAGRGWGLRTAKLRLSRKLTYSAGLLMCYSCALDPEQRAVHPDAEESAPAKIIDHLSKLARKPPLELMADALLAFPALDPAGKALFDTYDRFLLLLDDETKRARLDALANEEVADDSVYQEVRALGHEFQAALDMIFFNEKDAPELFRLTKTYGLF